MIRRAAGLLLALRVALVVGGAGGCAPRSSPQDPSSSATAAATEPRWEDAIDPKAGMLLVVRPRTLRLDPVYGPLLQRVVQLARERSAFVTATRALDAIEDADALVLAVSDRTATATQAARGLDPASSGAGAAPASDAGSDMGRDAGTLGDLVFVIRGVRADLDPGNLVGDDGRGLWKAGPSGPVRELVLDRDDGGAVAASLFELPGRTWVIASGDSRLRVRDAMSRRARGDVPGRRLPSILDPANRSDAVAEAWLSGPSLVGHVPVLRPPSLLAPLGRRLETVTLSLSPGAGAFVRATLTYRDDDAAGPAAARIREAMGALRGAKPNDYAWLGAASVEELHRRVVVTAPLPKDILGAIVLPGRAAPAVPPPPVAR